MTETTKNFLTALERMAEDIPVRLTCSEADAVAEHLRELGATELAETWLDEHALGDREVDEAHYDRAPKTSLHG